MGELIQFPDQSEDKGTPYRVCACGEAWFRLDGFITMSTDGSITGYSGIFNCANCGVRIAS